MNIRSNPDTTLPARHHRPAARRRARSGSRRMKRRTFACRLREIILSEGAGEPNLPVYDTSRSLYRP